VLTERDCQDARLLAPYEPTQLTVLRASLDPHLTASDAAALLQDLRPSVLLVRSTLCNHSQPNLLELRSAAPPGSTAHAASASARSPPSPSLPLPAAVGATGTRFSHPGTTAG
jgi:hypothetical protein